MNVEFSDALTYLTPVICFHAKRAHDMIPGLEYDDVYQELMLELWRQHDKTPRDMVTYDYRFSRYYGSVFRNRVFHLNRALLYRKEKGKYRDMLNLAIPIPEDAEDFIELKALFISD